MAEKLAEAAIREALIRRLRQTSEALVLEEVKVEGGAARIDVATFGGEIVGYEIKSDFDNFDRMANQIHAYNRVFNKIYLVCGERHLDYALAILPRWWGMHLASSRGSQVEIELIREAKTHERQDPYSVASLLSKQDAIELLRLHQCPIRARPSLRELWEAMAATVPVRKIEHAVVRALSGGKQDANLSFFGG